MALPALRVTLPTGKTRSARPHRRVEGETWLHGRPGARPNSSNQERCHRPFPGETTPAIRRSPVIVHARGVRCEGVCGRDAEVGPAGMDSRRPEGRIRRGATASTQNTVAARGYSCARQRRADTLANRSREVPDCRTARRNRHSSVRMRADPVFALSLHIHRCISHAQGQASSGVPVRTGHRVGPGWSHRHCRRRPCWWMLQAWYPFATHRSYFAVQRRHRSRPCSFPWLRPVRPAAWKHGPSSNPDSTTSPTRKSKISSFTTPTTSNPAATLFRSRAPRPSIGKAYTRVPEIVIPGR